MQNSLKKIKVKEPGKHIATQGWQFKLSWFPPQIINCLLLFKERLEAATHRFLKILLDGG